MCKQPDDDKDGIIYQPFVNECTSDYNSIWSGAIYIIKGKHNSMF